MTIALVVAGGPPEEAMDLAPFIGDPSVIAFGADRGAQLLVERGFTPAVSIGDFDSIDPAALARVKACSAEFIRVPQEKNETDTDLALDRALAYRPAVIYVTGATGGRLDHFISVLNRLYALQKSYSETRFLLANRDNELSFYGPGAHRIAHRPDFPYISFYSYGEPVEGISLTGFRYGVSGERIPLGETRFTSNEVDASGATLSLSSGTCLAVRSRDAAAQREKMPAR